MVKATSHHMTYTEVHTRFANKSRTGNRIIAVLRMRYKKPPKQRKTTSNCRNFCS